MRTVLIISGMICVALSEWSAACECVNTERSCEYLHNDAVFVGRVLSTVPVKHPVEDKKDTYTFGYSMRFAVEEPLRGELGNEVTIETGSGGGDCGTPFRERERLLIFAYKHKNGELWTGACSGNQALLGDGHDRGTLDEYRALVRKSTGSIFGRVTRTNPRWRDDDVDDESSPRPIAGMLLHAKAEQFSATTKTKADGSYEFEALPKGSYAVTPEAGSNLDFDHEDEDRYRAELSNGQCVNVSFRMEPKTRIRGHLTLPSGIKSKNIQVVAIPIHLKELNQYSGKWDLTDEDDRFDLWPLPPGDYYVGVNINSSPKEASPFPPTYYPGVTDRKAAELVHVREGEIKELELPLREVARQRLVHFVAIGLDGKPMKTIYIQLEDLRHPGDASSYVNVDLDDQGQGTVTVYAGYSYHLHGSHYVSWGTDWCSKPVSILAGSEPVEVQFVMDHKDSNCMIDEIDGLRK